MTTPLASIVLLSVLTTLALSTADICDDPMRGGSGEPRVCLLSASQRIDTPYYSIEVAPGQLVGIDSNGRRLQVQGSLWQSPIAAVVRVVSEPELARELVRIKGSCADFRLVEGEIALCDRSTADVIARVYATRSDRVVIVADLNATSIGLEMLPGYERMIQGIDVERKGGKPEPDGVQE